MMKTESYKVKGGTVYILPDGRRVLLTDSDMSYISWRVGVGLFWSLLWPIFMAILFLALAASAFALQSPREATLQVNAQMGRWVTLEWEAASVGAANYSIAYGTSSSAMTRMLNAGAETSATVSGLERRKNWFFVCRAYDISGNKVGGDSNMVSVRTK